MASLADIFAEVKLDLTKAEEGRFRKKIAGIDTKAEGAKVATRFGVGFNGAFGGIASRSAGIFAAGFAAVQGLKVFGGFINDARESAKVARLTSNVIKSTGGAAKITAGQVGALATAISNKTGADDEAIQSGQNLLLTFTNIKNGVGAGNDIFNQASQAITDMAASMNGGEVTADGLKTSSIQLGKALNDPVKGITALSKVGVSFTQSQKDQIKTLVDSGKTMEAQKIILGELNKEFGGAAAAAADPLTRLKTVAGNLSETVGGLLLPAVDKFANFAINTAIPGVQGLIAAFQGEGVTSNGFVGFMERVGVTARAAFGYFKTDVLPRLQQFGGFVVGTVVPAVASFAKNLTTTLWPAVQSVFGFFKAEVLPRLQQFGGFLGSSVLPKLGQLATSLSKNKDFLVPFVTTIVAIVAAVKAWSIIQGVLNVVLAANPIGLVIVALAALVGGLVYAYKNSDKFRAICQAAFKVVAAAGQFMWNAILKPMFALMVATLKYVWGQAQGWARIVVAAFNFIKDPAVQVFKFVVGQMLNFVGTMINAAAKAFGWVPKIGGPLKNAAAEFNKFRDKTNAALAGITDQTIKITPQFSSTATMVVGGVRRSVPLNTIGSAGRGMADGGGVFGGVPGKDSVPAMLMPDEHVWTTKEVSAVGGHGAMYRMRKAALRGDLRGFAAGGTPRHLNVQTFMPNSTKFAREVAAHSVLLAKPAAQQLANQFANQFGAPDSGPPGARKSFRGVTLNSRTIRMLLNAERILGAMFHITQGSYSTRVAASGSTHAGGGAMDTNGPRGWNVAVGALRKAGFAAWHRTPSQGPWNHHIHSIAIGDPTASAAAKAQVRSFLRGGNGLGGMALGGRVLLRDQGGPLPHGMFAYNGSGKTERVLTAEQDAARRGTTVVVNVPGVVGMTRQDLRNYLVKELDYLRSQRRV